ncbi:hypothetical protein BKH42_00650 [Helicobacter sp. 13S00482-2]|uniref:glycosyltransferase family 32 protein n=1 Tax=Helicobacter sp. 13S00482-2 TaxID=1476200 RepID=UPI000BCE2B3B|nr:glycosyltransferase [Helicobacter sp. 13S00482-2]PAF54455.1 hypothetical protein BKH42_00650 [Helicobacter sp. 13S00482-2]
MSLKVVHRIFFGFGGEEDIYQEYFQNWKEKLKGYEFRNWNATNLPLDVNSYVRAMVKLQDGVFLSDYFRWWVLKEYGGIYLDGDIEIVSKEGLDILIDELSISEEYDAIIGIESNQKGGYTSHSMASKPNSNLAKFMCEIYENLGKLYLARKELLIGPKITALYFLDNGSFNESKGYIFGFKEPIIADRVKIYPKDYFSPISYGKTPILEDLTHRSVLAHHYGNSWWEKDSYFFVQKQAMLKRRKMIKDYLREQKTLKFRFKQFPKKIILKILFPIGSKRRLWIKNLADKIINMAIK